MLSRLRRLAFHFGGRLPRGFAHCRLTPWTLWKVSVPKARMVPDSFEVKQEKAQKAWHGRPYGLAEPLPDCSSSRACRRKTRAGCRVPAWSTGRVVHGAGGHSSGPGPIQWATEEGVRFQVLQFLDFLGLGRCAQFS